jgi:hypothetical protein
MIVGKTLSMNGVQHAVVGIAPEGYCWHLGECPGTQLFVPLERHPRLRADERLRFDREIAWVRMHGRLAPGVAISQANAAAAAVMSRLAEQHPASSVLLVARTAAGIQPTTLASAFQNAVRDLDPNFTAASLITGDVLKSRGMDDILVPSTMVGGGGGVVLTLAALGIYGVIGFMVVSGSEPSRFCQNRCPRMTTGAADRPRSIASNPGPRARVTPTVLK